MHAIYAIIPCVTRKRRGFCMAGKKYFADRDFYKKVLAISVPIIIQNSFTHLVSLLDNVMVGTIGTEAMSGVSIVNEFLFIFNLFIFGAVSSAGLFTAQYHGTGDVIGVRHTFRFKIITNLIAAAIGILAFSIFSETLISTFLHESTSSGDLALTMTYGKEYLGVMLIGLVPYSIAQAYASTSRETGDAKLPMIASVTAVLTNLVLNAILIFGLFGLPALGVVGAAIATVISRFVELSVLIVGMYSHKDKYPFVKDAFSSLYIPPVLVRSIALKGLPIMLNELLWAASVTARNTCYATRGLDVVASLNISTTIGNLFSVAYMAIGAAIAIIVGNQLGAGEIEEAKESAKKINAFALVAASVMAVALAALSPVFPLMYNTSSEVRAYATYFIIIRAIIMPIQSVSHSMYYTIRSGGRVFVTMLFDSVFMWTIAYPLALGISLTQLGIQWFFPISQAAEIIKVVIGAVMIRRIDWARRIVPESQNA